MRSSITCAMAVAVVLAMVCTAGADPLPGRDFLKFSQKPMIRTEIPDPSGLPAVYFGHDELSTAWSYTPEDPLYAGVFMADDFADPYDRAVVHVKWWGSYMSPADAAKRVNRFAIAFENDVPADFANDPYDFSHPDCAGSKHTQISVATWTAYSGRWKEPSRKHWCRAAIPASRCMSTTPSCAARSRNWPIRSTGSRSSRWWIRFQTTPRRGSSGVGTTGTTHSPSPWRCSR